MSINMYLEKNRSTMHPIIHLLYDIADNDDKNTADPTLGIS